MEPFHGLRVPVALTIGAAALAFAAISASAAVSRAGADSEIAVTMGKPGELSMKTSARRAKAGEVEFVIKNKGKLAHEFILLRTPTPAAKLKPRAAEPEKVEEPGFHVEVEDMRPGQGLVLVLSLKKGHYVLLCNIAGHHAGGMRADLLLK